VCVCVGMAHRFRNRSLHVECSHVCAGATSPSRRWTYVATRSVMQVLLPSERACGTMCEMDACVLALTSYFVLPGQLEYSSRQKRLALTVRSGMRFTSSVAFVECVCWHGASIVQSIASCGVFACMRRHNTALRTLNLSGNRFGAAGVAAIGEGLRYDV
jgi:hypothetical protein